MANRLAGEASAYLKQHAHNPVDWYPWGEEAFRAAREGDKPIFLSVGYSACHWCHVMAHESFEDPGLARALSEGFVCIKVDREERPDVDQLYQGVAQLTGRGGWPLTVFLTHRLEPFFAGTYFPPADRFGMPGLPRVLASVLEAWRERRDEVESSARELLGALGSLMSAGLSGEAGELTAGELAQVARRLSEEIDPVRGGFSGAPKFPHPALLDLLLRSWRRDRDEELLNRVLLSLDAMAEGGLFDQLGGGFHRYSTDEAWQVPHFEKMLYDNAQLLRLYAEAQTVRASPLYARVVAQTVGWLARELRSPEGAFYSSQDADSEGGEGAFFVWTPRELDEAAGGLSALLRRHFGVGERGNFEGGRTVLSIAEPLSALAAALGRSESELARDLERGRGLLFAARERRPRPGRDEKILAGWNGLAIGALAKAARVFDQPGWLSLARRAADFALGPLSPQGRLMRTFAQGRARLPGQLEDFGDLAEGLVQLYMASFEPRYLEAAARLADEARARFWDEAAGAFRAAAQEGEPLPVPVFAIHDDAWPSGASTLCEAEILLAALTADSPRLERARRYLERMRAPMLANPLAFGRLCCAATALLEGAPSLLVVGSAEPARELVREANRHYAPTLALARGDPSGDGPKILRSALEGKSAPAGGARAYFCRAFSCEPPAEDARRLGERLEATAPA